MNGLFRIIIGVVFVVALFIVGLTDTGINDWFDSDKSSSSEDRLLNNSDQDSSDSLFSEPASDESLLDISKRIDKEGLPEEDKGQNKESKGEEVKLTRVIDGDTIIVEMENDKGKLVEERVRLLLIDTPESVHPTEPVEAFGVESSDYAEEYFKGVDKVHLEIGEDERDKYDRLLAHVWVDGENFNLHMVEKGYARVAYVYEPNTKYIDEFREAEEKAKKKEENIWSVDGYVTDKGFDMSVID